jgi:protoporphyrinogen oxidase
MKKNKDQIVIIGAGISGLICAFELEQAGFAPTIIDKWDQIGGRVRTDIVDGFALDHGFQVLLTEYPAAKKYLDYDELKLKKFLPGAVIFQNGKGSKFGDPLRNPSFLFPMTVSSVGTLVDKMKLYKLAQMLKKKDLKSIFQEKEQTTMAYLEGWGFSSRIIELFFRPFYSGIFLEQDLNTSSRMFEFVFKMFSSGSAAIPSQGIQSIPNQLKEKLTKTTFILGQEVKLVSGNEIQFNDRESMQADRIIIASDPSSILGTQKDSPAQWKGCATLYFTVADSRLKAPIIGLIPASDSVAKHFHYVTDVLGEQERQLLSVTVIQPIEMDDQSLIERVKNDLNDHTGIKGLKFLKLYRIPRSLPILDHVTYAPDKRKLKISEHVFLAGDFLANGSLNAAMESGKAAAEAVLENIQQFK